MNCTSIREMLKVSEISKSYDEVRALNKISFSVDQGELFGLIGPDGAGKTSIFRIIATLLLPDEGNVLFDGRDVVEDYEHVRKNVGYMPGRFSLYQDLSVRENLDFFATIFNTSVDENMYLIREIFKQLEPFQKRRAGALSGGMKQKLALSCALIHKPKMLLLDEPTTGVDAVSRKEFWNMLQGLKEQGITILVSTPYMDESRLCDRVALMQEGEIMDMDQPQVIASNMDRTVFEIRGEDLYSILDEMREVKGVARAYPFGDSIHVYGEKGIDADEHIRSRFPDAGLHIRVIEPGIEDAFMNLMVRSDE